MLLFFYFYRIVESVFFSLAELLIMICQNDYAVNIPINVFCWLIKRKKLEIIHNADQTSSLTTQTDRNNYYENAATALIMKSWFQMLSGPQFFVEREWFQIWITILYHSVSKKMLTRILEDTVIFYAILRCVWVLFLNIWEIYHSLKKYLFKFNSKLHYGNNHEGCVMVFFLTLSKDLPTTE